MDLDYKKGLAQDSYTDLTIKEKCSIIGLNRSSLYYKAKPLTEDQIFLLYRTAEIFANYPFYGYRRLQLDLLDEGFNIGKEKTRQNMKKLGLKASYPHKKTTIPNKEHEKYPYLLKDLAITRPNQVWSTDITYIWNGTGFFYLVAVIDWYSRKILSWRLSNTMDKEFCIEALEDALAKHPKPDIFNTDQGSQFTSIDFTGVLKKHKIKISMDGKGRAIDNIIIERFWRSLKYEDIFLKEYSTGLDLKSGIAEYIKFYNQKRKHSSLEYKTPAEIHGDTNRKEVYQSTQITLIDFEEFRNLLLKKAV